MQREAAQGTSGPKLNDQLVEQCLAREALSAIIDRDIENLGKDCRRIAVGATPRRHLPVRGLGRLVERDDHLPGQYAGGVLLLVHGPDDVPCLSNRGLQFRAALACGFEDCREVAQVPVLEDDGDPAVGAQQPETGSDAPCEALFVVFLRVISLAADNCFLFVCFIGDGKAQPMVPQDRKM